MRNDMRFETREQYESYRAAQLTRELRIALALFIQAKVRAAQTMLPTMQLYLDGHRELQYSDEDRETLDSYDVCIASVQKMFLSSAHNQMYRKESPPKRACDQSCDQL